MANRRRIIRPFGFLAVALSLLLPLGLAAAEKRYGAAVKRPAVQFEPAGGVFTNHVLVKITTPGAGKVIRYTVDGSEPGLKSPTYDAPLVVASNTVLRARSFAADGAPSDVEAQVYTFLDNDLLGFSSNLPLGILHTGGSNIVKEQRILAGLQLLNAGELRTTFTAPLDHSGVCAINMRGRASLRYPKNSFTLKTLNGSGDAQDASLLDLPEDSDWVLYAPYPDKTLMRDVLAYELHREMGHWAPRTRFFELFISRGGKLSRRDYMGVYVLVERITRGGERLKMAKLKSEDGTEPRITGGYIFKKDHTDQGAGPMGGEGFVGVSTSTRAGYPTGPGAFPADPKGFQPAARTTRSSSSSSSSSRRVQLVTNHFGFPEHRPPPGTPWNSSTRDEFEDSASNEESFRTTQTNEFFFVEPEPDELTSVQKAWLKRHLNEVEAALYGPDFMDTAKGWRAYLDPMSFIDYHLIVETTKNVDGFRFSVFYHKDRGERIKADPIWDWNLSFGNANGKQGWIPEYWLWPQLDNREYTWYRRLFEDPDFAQAYVDRWAELRAGIFSTSRVLARVDTMAAQLEEAQKRNFEKWPILGRNINPNYFVGSSYAEEVDWMKKFIQTRLDWIEKQFLPVPALAKDRKLTAPAGEVYFTTDGSDPRASGGGVSAKAQKYNPGAAISSGAQLVARVRHEQRWSGPLRANVP